MRRITLIFLCCFLSLCAMRAFGQGDGTSAESGSASSGVAVGSPAPSTEASGVPASAVSGVTPIPIIDVRSTPSKAPKNPNAEENTPINLPAQGSKKSAAPQQEINPFVQFLKMLPSLALVLLLAYIAMLALQRFQQGGMRGVLAGLGGQAKPTSKLIKVLESTPLAPGRYLYVVAVGARVYLLGMTAQSMEVLGEVSDDELVAMKLRGDSEEQVAAPASSVQSSISSPAATMNSFIARMFSSNAPAAGPHAAAPVEKRESPSQTDSFLDQLEKARKSLNNRKEAGQ